MKAIKILTYFLLLNIILTSFTAYGVIDDSLKVNKQDTILKEHLHEKKSQDSLEKKMQADSNNVKNQKNNEHQDKSDGHPCNDSCLIIFIILISGVLGGIINYLSTATQATISSNNSSATSSANNPRAQNEEKMEVFYSDKNFYLQILLGICGAALIPLLLSLTKITLFTCKENCDPCFLIYLQFIGYCLLGAIFSRLILDNLSRRVFQAVNEAKQTSQMAKQDAQAAKQIVEDQRRTLIAPDQTSEATTTEIKEKASATKSFVNIVDKVSWKETADEEMKAVLDEMGNAKYVYRTATGLFNTIKKKVDTINESKIVLILNAFVDNGLAQKIIIDGKTYYYLTQKGKGFKFI